MKQSQQLRQARALAATTEQILDGLAEKAKALLDERGDLSGVSEQVQAERFQRMMGALIGAKLDQVARDEGPAQAERLAQTLGAGIQLAADPV